MSAEYNNPYTAPLVAEITQTAIRPSHSSAVRPRTSPEVEVRITNPSAAQLRIQERSHMANKIGQILATVEAGPNGELCNNNGEYFFREETESETVSRQKETIAKALCRNCPVVQSCLEEALEFDTVQGIWGGTTERERRRLANRRIY